MKIFLDTADLNAIKKWSATTIIDGVTTNPTLISKQQGTEPLALVREICELMGEDRDVSIEVTESEPEKVYAQAKRIAGIAENVVVKIPCHQDYLSVIERLVCDDIRINVTLVFTAVQALLMAKLCVSYVSPFIGRLEDSGENGLQLITDMREIFSTYEYDTEILAASIRSIDHIKEVALRGADIATVPPAILEKAFEHTLTQKGMDLFLADWKSIGKNIV